MRFLRLYLFFVLVFFQSHAQVSMLNRVKQQEKPTKWKNTNISLGISRVVSVVYLARNINDNNNAAGLNFALSYETPHYIRGTLEYNFYNSFDIAPTWYRVKAQTIEANVSVLARSADDKLFFYPLAGLSYNTFQGYFTGINDYLNLRSIYGQNTSVNNSWIGINAGVGMDYNFENSAIFFTYKMRIGKTAGLDQFNIQDVCLLVGWKLKIKTTSANFSHIFRNTRSRYTLKKRPTSK